MRVLRETLVMDYAIYNCSQCGFNDDGPRSVILSEAKHHVKETGHLVWVDLFQQDGY